MVIANLELKKQLYDELTGNILPYWMEKMSDNVNGGFYGQIDGTDNIVPKAPKGGILNARILWTFSAAYRLMGKPEYLKFASRAKDYIFKHFLDDKFGGTYWSLNYDGKPLETKKQIYAQAFFIYALSEYYLATGDESCKSEAIKLFNLIEEYSFDWIKGGYYEAFNREWQILDDLRLSDKDANEKKTMNTHLHILEAYTNLYRIWKNDHLEVQLENLIKVFSDKIIDRKSYHQNLFFDEDWVCKSSIISYGHDIECSWLLFEAAIELGDSNLIEIVSNICIKMVEAVLDGVQPDGSLIYEKNTASQHKDYERHWWPQAEAVVGFYNAFELAGNTIYLEYSANALKYIQDHLIDKKNGEWRWSIYPDGSINQNDDKAGFWKCPYHNGRMCIEIIRRISSAGE